MFVKVENKKGAKNKGSSSGIIEYLSKENEGKDYKDFEHFFNHDNDKINETQAQLLLDKMNRGIAKQYAKFFTFTINPSKEEINHLYSIIGVKKDTPVSNLTIDQKKSFDAFIKSYTKNVMELYAANFNRGLKAKDLVYIAKVEHNRKFKSFAEEVKKNESITSQLKKLNIERIKAELSSEKRDLNNINKQINKLKSEYITVDGLPLKNDKSNLIKRGMNKPGNNTHVHVVVHRNTKDFVKISPNAASKGHSQKTATGKAQIGFSHEEFKINCNELFKQQFNYKSSERESYYKSYEKMAVDRVVSKKINKYKRNVKNTAKNSVKGRVQAEVSKHILGQELMEIKARAVQAYSLINTISKVTAPHKLLSDLGMKVVGKMFNETKSRI